MPRQCHIAADESWRPSPKFLEEVADAVHCLFFPPAPEANMQRFKAQVQAAIEYQKHHDEARAKLERREQEHREKVKQDPQLRDHQAGPPKKGWEWEGLFIVEVGATSIQEGAWLPPDLARESALPPEPVPSGIPPENTPPEVLLTGEYVVLAVVHDDADTANRRGRPRLLTGFDLPPCFSLFLEYGPCSRPALNVHGFDCETINRALEDVKADLAAATAATPPKNLTAKRAAAYIRQNHGCKTAAIAKHCDVEPTTFRSHISPILKDQGFTCTRGCNAEWNPPKE